MRATILQRIRAFFAERDCLEVETPILSRAGTVERQIDSLRAGEFWLATSPEFAMKRLLAAGSGAIFQISRVFRVDECGRRHNPEFSMLEWYRPGFGLQALMDEVAALLQTCASAAGHPRQEVRQIRYADLFLQHLQLDPHSCSAAELRTALISRALALPPHSAAEAADRDFWLDLAMGVVLGPQLGDETPCFVYDYPASQAALARLRTDAEGRTVAARFELFWRGMELANGYHELTDATEQQRRFEADQHWRAAHGRPVPPYDRQLIAALSHGLPDCAGVALGIDRLLMAVLGATHIREVVAFDSERA